MSMFFTLMVMVLVPVLTVAAFMLYTNRCAFCETRWHSSLQTMGSKSLCTLCVPKYVEEKRRQEEERKLQTKAKVQVKEEVTIVCPVDGATLLKRQTASKVTIDVCPTCEGSWLDQGELDKLTSNAMKDRGLFVSAGLEEELAVLAEATENLEPERQCPHDGSLMGKVSCGPVVLDRCDSCKGIWLDREELSVCQATIQQQLIEAKELRIKRSPRLLKKDDSDSTGELLVETARAAGAVAVLLGDLTL